MNEELQNDIYETKPYKRTRIAYVAEAIFPYLTTLLAGDAFLANLLTEIGLTPSLTGLIASFGSLAFIFSLLNLVIIKFIKTSKTVTIVTLCLSQTMYLLLYLIPFTSFSKGVKIALVFVFMICAYLFAQSTSTIFFQWAQKFVDPERRGDFGARLEMVSLAAAFVFTLSIGKIVDMFKNANNIRGGFLFVACSILVLTVFNFISLMMMEKDDLTKENGRSGVPLKETILYLLTNSGYWKVVVATILYYISMYLTIGFLGTFKIQEMAISVGTVQLFTNLGILARIFVSAPLGKLADKHSFVFVAKVSYLIQICSLLAIALASNQKLWWLILVYSILYNISLAGLETNFNNIIFDFVEPKHIASALAVRSVISGIFAFSTAIIGSKILAFVQAGNNTFFGIRAYGQQVLATISIIILFVDVLFTHFILEKHGKEAK